MVSSHFNEQDKRDAINGEVLEGINQAFSDLSLNPEARVILLQGAGAAFSAEIDFNYLATVTRDDGRAPGIRLREGIDTIHSILNRIEKIEKLSGGRGSRGCARELGCELALAQAPWPAGGATLRKSTEIILGIIPDCGGTTRLTRMLGHARAKELIMTETSSGAPRAVRWAL